MFRKNLIEFSVRFDYYLYKCLLVYAHISHNYKTFTKNYIVFPYYLYLILIVPLDVFY